MRGHGVAVDIGHVFVRELGPTGQPPESGAPLLVVHGGPDWDHHYLLPGLESLASRRLVLAMDLRGCGASSRGLPAGTCQPSNVVGDILAVVDDYGFDRVDLLGFSFGGRLVQLFAQRHRDRIRSLVLASTSAYDGERQATYQRRSDAWCARSELCPPREWPKSVDGDLAALARRWAFEQVPVDVWDEELFPAYRTLLETVDFSADWLRESVMYGLGASCPDDAPAVLAASRLPTLVLHGEFDLTFPVALATDLAREVPHARLDVIAGTGHMSQFEKPDVWAHSVNEFLT